MHSEAGARLVYCGLLFHPFLGVIQIPQAIHPQELEGRSLGYLKEVAKVKVNDGHLGPPEGQVSGDKFLPSLAKWGLAQ